MFGWMVLHGVEDWDLLGRSREHVFSRCFRQGQTDMDHEISLVG